MKFTKSTIVHLSLLLCVFSAILVFPLPTFAENVDVKVEDVKVVHLGNGEDHISFTCRFSRGDYQGIVKGYVDEVYVSTSSMTTPSGTKYFATDTGLPGEFFIAHSGVEYSVRCTAWGNPTGGGNYQYYATDHREVPHPPEQNGYAIIISNEALVEHDGIQSPYDDISFDCEWSIGDNGNGGGYIEAYVNGTKVYESPFQYSKTSGISHVTTMARSNFEPFHTLSNYYLDCYITDIYHIEQSSADQITLPHTSGQGGGTTGGDTGGTTGGSTGGDTGGDGGAATGGDAG